MSYYIVNEDGSYVGDLASNNGLSQLRQAAGPRLQEFLNTGEADVRQVQAIIAECRVKPAQAYIADYLSRGAKPPVLLSDGCGDIASEKHDE